MKSRRPVNLDVPHLRKRKMKVVIFIICLLPLLGAINAGGLTVQALNPPLVKYCDLVANPSAYDGREIRLTGIYSVIGTGDSRFFSSACSDGATLWVEFKSNYQSCSSSKVVKSLMTMRRRSGWRWARPGVSVITGRSRSADVEFVGRFSASNQFRKADSPETDGPLGAIRPNRERYDFVFNVSWVLRVKPLPKGAKY